MLLQDYISEVNKRVAEEAAYLARGGAASFDEYKHRVGIIKGLNVAVDILTEVYKSKPPEERN